MNLRELKIIVEELHRSDRWVGRRQQVRIDRQERAVVSADCRSRAGASKRQVAGAGGELALAFIDTDARVDEGVVNGRVDHAAVIDAPATAQTRFAVAGQVVSKTDTRTDVVFVADLVAGLRQQRIR